MAKTSAVNLTHISVSRGARWHSFRSFVYQLAIKYNLSGGVCNTWEDVEIEVEGSEEDFGQFLLDLREQAPPLYHIKEIAITRGVSTPLECKLFHNICTLEKRVVPCMYPQKAAALPTTVMEATELR